MKTIENKKRAYSNPVINPIKLDNEISLALQSYNDPMGGPGEEESHNINAPEYFNIDPYKNNIG